MTSSPKALLLALAVAAPVSLEAAVADAQTTAALLPPSGSNVHPGIMSAANEVLRDHLQRTGKYTVIAVPGEPMAEEPSAAQAAEQARAAKADVAIVLRITRLANTARVRLSAYRASDAHLLHWDSMASGGTPDDLDPVLARLAAGLASGKPVRETADIETVTSKEQDTLNKREATRTFGLRVSGLLPLDRAGGNAAAVPGLGIFWMYDARAWLADVSIDWGHSGENSSFAIGVGAYYPFSRTDISPYVGGSVRYGWTEFGGQGASGLVLQPTGGLLIGRLSSVQIRAELGYFINTYAEKESMIGGDPSMEHVSHGPTLSVGIGF